jgi:hypothetical protein
MTRPNTAITLTGSTKGTHHVLEVMQNQPMWDQAVKYQQGGPEMPGPTQAKSKSVNSMQPSSS